MHVLESILEPHFWLSQQEIQRRIQDCIELTVEKASKDISGALVARDLLPSDLGETNEIWTEQLSTTANAWENGIIASQSIPDQVFVGIYGLVDTSDPQMAAGLRFTVGTGRRLQISLFNLLSEDKSLRARTGFLRSPLVISQNQAITIDQYVRAATPQAAYSVEIAWLGVAVEVVGRRLQP